ncbi:MAG TPA: hypothetical protein VFW95_10250 [Candidatus Limnocylindria bacterium]|nr:hypothetical protein [Candidatus Limnocylindria bacterium]
MSRTDPGRVLRRAILAWGLGHLALGRASVGVGLLVAEVAGILLVAWLTIGLSESSAYLIPFMAGVLFLVAWTWQAIAAYRSAQGALVVDLPRRAPAAALGWLGVPLLIWGTGFWLDGARCATPAAVLDRFTTQWTTSSLGQEWSRRVTDAADRAADRLGDREEQFRDVRIRVVDQDDASATAVAELIHFERTETRILGIFPATELTPVVDRTVLTLELGAQPVELPGGGDIGAVCWELASADTVAP